MAKKIPLKFKNGAENLSIKDLEAYPHSSKDRMTGRMTAYIPSQYFYISDIQWYNWLVEIVTKKMFSKELLKTFAKTGWGVQEIVAHKISNGRIQFIATVEYDWTVFS